MAAIENNPGPSEDIAKALEGLSLAPRHFAIRSVSGSILETLNCQVTANQEELRLAYICLDKATRLMLGEASDDIPVQNSTKG